MSEIISRKTVIKLTSLSKGTIYAMERKGLFPQKIQLSPNRVGYYYSEVISWMETRRQKKLEPQLPTGRNLKFEKKGC